MTISHSTSKQLLFAILVKLVLWWCRSWMPSQMWLQAHVSYFERYVSVLTTCVGRVRESQERASARMYSGLDEKMKAIRDISPEGQAFETRGRSSQSNLAKDSNRRRIIFGGLLKNSLSNTSSRETRASTITSSRASAYSIRNSYSESTIVREGRVHTLYHSYGVELGTNETKL